MGNSPVLTGTPCFRVWIWNHGTWYVAGTFSDEADAENYRQSIRFMHSEIRVMPWHLYPTAQVR